MDGGSRLEHLKAKRICKLRYGFRGEREFQRMKKNIYLSYLSRRYTMEVRMAVEFFLSLHTTAFEIFEEIVWECGEYMKISNLPKSS